MIDCVLVTCEEMPALDPDDRLLAEELRHRGLTVTSAIWSDANVDWSESKVCIVRSTWDYHRRYDDFGVWLDRVRGLTTILNRPELLRWNADKRYLRDLRARGVRIVPTIWAHRGQSIDLHRLCRNHRLDEVVIKPARGAATHDVLLVRQTRGATVAQAHLDRLLRAQDALIQPYFGSVVSYGERALVFFETRYSHAVAKKPFDRTLSVRGDSTPSVEAASDEVELARRALTSVPMRPMYARVDLLRDRDGNACVNEVELIEPALYFAAYRPALTRFAGLIEREIRDVTARRGYGSAGRSRLKT